jgi:alpha-N-arabinofuranosidase
MIHLPPPTQSIARVSIDLSAPGVAVSPTLYGLMTEEINYSYDGGLYAELVRNRSFLDDPKRPIHWSPVGEGSSVSLVPSGPSAERPVALQVHGGVANEGYWGIPVRPSTSYRLEVWAKSEPGLSIQATIESPSGSTTFGRVRLKPGDGQWQKLAATLGTANDIKPTIQARLVLRGEGDFLLSQVSLFPPTFKGRTNGNRPDLMKMLVDMRPKFLRFPGGNYLEGNTLKDQFPWKQTLGPIETRPGHNCPWGYRSSDGMGLHEFLLWSEDMKAKPVLAVYAGYALNGKYVKPGRSLEPLVQDALDEIEYVIGGPDTKWGAQRASAGHPKPFPLECVEVGNEDGFDKSGSYEARFVQFYDAIKAKYPRLKVISTTGGHDYLGQKFPIVQRTPDLWDEHYYSEAWDMMGMASKYDSYDRKGPKIFVGEWASHDTTPPWQAGPKAGPTPNMKCALGDAAFMTGLERNSDVVRMACYAPLLVNVNPGGRQWSLNLIGYDALNVFGSPSYYAQKMFAEHLGNRTVPLALSGVPTQSKGDRTLPALFASATRNTNNGDLHLKLVNALPTAQDVELECSGGSFAPDATMIVLAGDLKAMNTIDEPTNIEPVTTTFHGLGNTFRQTLPPHSVVVLSLRGRR